MHAPSVYRKLARAAVSASLVLLSWQAIAGDSIVRIVAFGASLTDTGNAFVWLSQPENESCGTPSNVPPYQSVDDLLIPDGPYARGGHHFSNGATWIEGLARDLALAGNAQAAFRSAGAQATNYAVGGARAVPDYPCRINLPEQVDIYLADFPRTSGRTLVAIEIGGNDVRDALGAAASGQDPAPHIAHALGSLYFNINRLYDGGAREFLVLNVPDIGKTPAVRALGPAAVYYAGLLSTSYNVGLLNAVDLLRVLHPDIGLRILDVHAKLDDVVANPATYGLLNVTDACITPNQPPFKCTNPDAYLFWDGIHPTKALHAIVAQQAFSEITGH